MDLPEPLQISCSNLLKKVVEKVSQYYEDPRHTVERENLDQLHQIKRCENPDKLCSILRKCATLWCEKEKRYAVKSGNYVIGRSERQICEFLQRVMNLFLCCVDEVTIYDIKRVAVANFKPHHNDRQIICRIAISKDHHSMVLTHLSPNEKFWSYDTEQFSDSKRQQMLSEAIKLIPAYKSDLFRPPELPSNDIWHDLELSSDDDEKNIPEPPPKKKKKSPPGSRKKSTPTPPPPPETTPHSSKEAASRLSPPPPPPTFQESETCSKSTTPHSSKKRKKSPSPSETCKSPNPHNSKKRKKSPPPSETCNSTTPQEESSWSRPPTPQMPACFQPDTMDEMLGDADLSLLADNTDLEEIANSIEHLLNPPAEQPALLSASTTKTLSESSSSSETDESKPSSQKQSESSPPTVSKRQRLSLQKEEQQNDTSKFGVWVKKGDTKSFLEHVDSHTIEDICKTFAFIASNIPRIKSVFDTFSQGSSFLHKLCKTAPFRKVDDNTFEIICQCQCPVHCPTLWDLSKNAGRPPKGTPLLNTKKSEAKRKKSAK